MKGFKALKEFHFVGYGMFYKDKTYFLAPELADILIKRNLGEEFIPKEKEAYSKKKKTDKIVSDNI